MRRARANLVYGQYKPDIPGNQMAWEFEVVLISDEQWKHTSNWTDTKLERKKKKRAEVMTNCSQFIWWTRTLHKAQSISVIVCQNLTVSFQTHLFKKPWKVPCWGAIYFSKTKPSDWNNNTLQSRSCGNQRWLMLFIRCDNTAQKKEIHA